jgi:serine/threonine-protein kinase
MEYLEGEDLSQRLERGPLPIDEAVDYVLQACAAIAEAHRVGIVHRDLKPGNLFLARRRDGTSTVKVVDFGISKVASTAQREERALTTTLMGSPFYMSPEQLRGDRDVDGRADIWALGIVLFELLTAEGAFDAPTMPQLCMRIMSEPPRRASELRADLPPGLDAVIDRCLQRDRAARFADVAALADALAPFARAVVIVPTPAPPRRRATITLVAGGGLLATFVATFGIVRALSSQAVAPVDAMGATTASAEQTSAVTAPLTESPSDPNAPVVVASTSSSPTSFAARSRPAAAKRAGATTDEFGGRK